jgi:RNA polymerase sigma factor (sigma-70 family)
MEAAALPRPTLASRGLSLPAAVLRLRSDEQLIGLFRGGSDEAFCVIHDRYRPRLLAYARQMLGGSQADAEDVLQDVFVRAHAALRRSDAPITLRAWLYRIAHNRCIDALRRPDPTPAEITPGTQPALARGAQHDPPIEAERSEDLRRLVRDLLDLPEQQRSALLMRELQGLSYDELACSLGVSVGAVKSLLVRARSGVLSAAVARDAPCAEICVELAETHDRGVRASGHVRRHLRECAGCRQHRADLRNQSRQFAALGPPVGLLGLLGGLGGGGGAGGGLAAAGGGGAIAAVALVGGAGSALTSSHHAAAPRPAAVARPRSPALAAAVTHRARVHVRTSIAPGAVAAPAATLTEAAAATCPAATADPVAAAPSAAATSIPAASGSTPVTPAPASAAADPGGQAPVQAAATQPAAAACAVSPGVAATTPAVTSPATNQPTTPAAPADPTVTTSAPGPDATATPVQTSPTATASTTPVTPADGSGQGVGDPQPANTGGVQAPSD